MSNTINTMDISIEKFAAFLDGNLSDDEMQSVTNAIDGNEMYSDIMSGVVAVDDYMPEVMPEEMYDIPSEDDILLSDMHIDPANENFVDVVSTGNDDDQMVSVVSNDNDSHVVMVNNDAIEVTQEEQDIYHEAGELNVAPDFPVYDGSEADDAISEQHIDQID